MRIAHIVGTLDIGGAEMLVLRLSKLQKSQGHEPSVHYLFGTGVMEPAFLAAGIPVHSHNGGGKRDRIRSLARAFPALGIEAVHCHNVAPTLLGTLAARWAGIRCVVSTRHNMGRSASRVDDAKYALAGRLCRKVVAVCDAARRNLVAAPFADASRIITIYNGTDPVDLSGIQPPPGTGGFVLLQVGRMAAPKDPLTLLDAFHQMRPECPEARLWVVGDGPLLEPSKAHAKTLGLGDAVTFWGQQTDVRPFLAGASLFTLSSRSEGVPVAQLEAMAAGLPTVVTAAGGMPEVAAPGEGSAIVPIGDAAALAQAYLRYARDPALRERAGQVARLHFQQNFTLERMNADYLRLFAAR
ncbi:glycosyltransferase [Paludibaculum fermentans]|uniref:glycosyltransferase n=1 Tax=Paludibaculum fermentans TaxID=1473598 RepID=UPI003EBCCBD9